MEVFLVYLWLKLDVFITFVSIVASVSILLYLFGWIPRGSENYDEKSKRDSEYRSYFFEKNFCKWHTRLLIFGVVCLFPALLLPSSKETAILVGASIAVDVSKSPEGAKVATLLRGKANELLDEQINKLKKETK